MPKFCKKGKLYRKALSAVSPNRCKAMVAESAHGCALDDDCWAVIVQLLRGADGFSSAHCAVADLLSLGRACRQARSSPRLRTMSLCSARNWPQHTRPRTQTRRAAAAGLRDLDAACALPACPLSFLRLGFGDSGLFSCSSHGEAAAWEDISREMRRDVREAQWAAALRFGDTALHAAAFALLRGARALPCCSATEFRKTVSRLATLLTLASLPHPLCVALVLARTYLWCWRRLLVLSSLQRGLRRRV